MIKKSNTGDNTPVLPICKDIDFFGITLEMIDWYYRTSYDEVIDMYDIDDNVSVVEISKNINGTEKFKSFTIGNTIKRLIKTKYLIRNGIDTKN